MVGRTIRRQIGTIQDLTRHLNPLTGLGTMPGEKAVGDLLFDQDGCYFAHQTRRRPRCGVHRLAEAIVDSAWRQHKADTQAWRDAFRGAAQIDTALWV